VFAVLSDHGPSDLVELEQEEFQQTYIKDEKGNLNIKTQFGELTKLKSVQHPAIRVYNTIIQTNEHAPYKGSIETWNCILTYVESNSRYVL
jgi:hypothetical protein